MSARLTGQAMATDSGFTLVEVLVVIAIVAILAALAAPSFSHALNAQRSSAAVNELLGSLDRARSEAIRINTVVSMCAVADANAASPACLPPPGASAPSSWSQGWVIFAKAKRDGARGTIETNDLILWRAPAVNPNQQLIYSDGAESALTYGADGFRIGDGNSGLFTADVAGNLTPSSTARCVYVNATGQSRAGRYSNGECSGSFS